MPSDQDEHAIDSTAQYVGQLLHDRGWTLAVAESLTGGLLVQALARVEGSGDWLAGGIVAYSRAVKHEVLGVSSEKVVSADAAAQMASNVRDRLGADAAVAVTGVAGPGSQDGEPPGTVWHAFDVGGGATAGLVTTAGTPSEICNDAMRASFAPSSTPSVDCRRRLSDTPRRWRLVVVSALPARRVDAR